MKWRELQPRKSPFSSTRRNDRQADRLPPFQRGTGRKVLSHMTFCKYPMKFICSFHRISDEVTCAEIKRRLIFTFVLVLNYI